MYFSLPHSHPFQISLITSQNERGRKQEYPFMDVVPFLTGVVSTKSISINMPHKKLWINSFKTLDNQQRNRFSWGSETVRRRQEGGRGAESQHTKLILKNRSARMIAVISSPVCVLAQFSFFCLPCSQIHSACEQPWEDWWASQTRPSKCVQSKLMCPKSKSESSFF